MWHYFANLHGIPEIYEDFSMRMKQSFGNVLDREADPDLAILDLTAVLIVEKAIGRSTSASIEFINDRLSEQPIPGVIGLSCDASAREFFKIEHYLQDFSKQQNVGRRIVNNREVITMSRDVFVLMLAEIVNTYCDTNESVKYSIESLGKFDVDNLYKRSCDRRELGSWRGMDTLKCNHALSKFELIA